MSENQDIITAQEDQESSIDWVELISVLWSSRKLIATVTGIATIGAVVVSLLLPEYYKSTATLLPAGKKWESGEIPPGSAIYVPKKIEKEDKTPPILRDLVTILGSLAAITVAIVQVTRN